MNYSDLEVWKKSMQLVTDVYKLTNEFPQDERFRLTDQMCRAAISIPSNIAEGHSRKLNVDFARFLRISLGSTTELETQIVIAKNLDYTSEKKTTMLLEQCLEIRKMLHGLMKNLKSH